MSGLTIWFTGLSGAGKSTIGQRIATELRARGLRVEVLDGDEVRQTLSAGLGFSKEDRDINIRRIGFVAELLTRNGVVAITAAISPYKDTRAEVRRRVGRFVEVYVRCSIDVLSERDVKGLYKRALAGEIDHFTGISDPYEAPGRTRRDRRQRDPDRRRIGCRGARGSRRQRPPPGTGASRLTPRCARRRRVLDTRGPGSPSISCIPFSRSPNAST